MSDVDLDAYRAGFEQLAALGLGIAPTSHQIAEAEADAALAASAPAPDAPATAPTADRGFNPFRQAGDPDRYDQFSMAQMAALEVAMPGITDRLEKAAEWDRMAIDQANVLATESARTEHEARLRSDPEYLASHVRGQAAKKLASDYRWLTDAEKAELKAEGGVSDEDYAQIQAVEARRVAVETGMAS